MPRLLLAAALLILVAFDAAAQNPPPATATPSANTEVKAPTVPATTPADIQPTSKPVGVATTGGNPPNEARIAKQRERWKKMTPQQKEEMRQKAARRLQERFERLNAQEQAQVNTIYDQISKLTREQRSILLARINRKAYEERQQKKVMQDQESKAAPEAPAAATITPPASAPAAAPAETKPAAH